MNAEEIEQLQQQLAAHRQTLATLLQQVALVGTPYAPPGQLNAIKDARVQIAHLKQALRSKGIEVSNQFNDTEVLPSVTPGKESLRPSNSTDSLQRIPRPPTPRPPIASRDTFASRDSLQGVSSLPPIPTTPEASSENNIKPVEPRRPRATLYDIRNLLDVQDVSERLPPPTYTYHQLPVSTKGSSRFSVRFIVMLLIAALSSFILFVFILPPRPLTISSFKPGFIVSAVAVTPTATAANTDFIGSAVAVTPTATVANTQTRVALRVVGTGTFGVFLRSEPRMDAPQLATLPENTVVYWFGEEVAQDEHTWRKVTIQEGNQGWVVVDYLREQ